MSILIRGLDMPQGEEMLCIDVYPDGKVCIDLDLHCKRVATAIPVPPHGRLIDADAIEHDGWIASRIYQASPTEHVYETKHVNAFPTIIEAEEGKR